jgi:hypothetical protein
VPGGVARLLRFATPAICNERLQSAAIYSLSVFFSSLSPRSSPYNFVYAHVTWYSTARNLISIQTFESVLPVTLFPRNLLKRFDEKFYFLMCPGHFLGNRDSRCQASLLLNGVLPCFNGGDVICKLARDFLSKHHC